MWFKTNKAAILLVSYEEIVVGTREEYVYMWHDLKSVCYLYLYTVYSVWCDWWWSWLCLVGSRENKRAPQQVTQQSMAMCGHLPVQRSKQNSLVFLELHSDLEAMHIMKHAQT